MYKYSNEQIYITDIHGFTVTDAKDYIDKLVTFINEDIKEIVVIHGYKNGTALLNMIRKDFANPRVLRKILSLNPGITSLILK